MIEVIKRHLAERNMLKTAGLSLYYLEKREKKNVYGQQKPSFKMRLWM